MDGGRRCVDFAQMCERDRAHSFEGLASAHLRMGWGQARETILANSYKGHTVDALAVRGDEGRRSLRKALGSGQARDDPGMSEWGNPSPARGVTRKGANSGN